MNKEQIEEDLDILEMVSDLGGKLSCMHNVSTLQSLYDATLYRSL